MKKRILLGILLSAVICIVSVFTSLLAVQAEPTDVKGDINCDGVCDLRDYKLLKRKLWSLPIVDSVDETKFDFDGNGKVTSDDKAAMGAYLWDNNGDGKFDKDDYKMIEKYLTNYNSDAFTDAWLKKADFDGDGDVDLTDLNGVGNEVYEVWSQPY